MFKFITGKRTLTIIGDNNVSHTLNPGDSYELTVTFNMKGTEGFPASGQIEARITYRWDGHTLKKLSY